MKYQLILLLLCFAITAKAQNHVTVSASLGEHTISRHIYGHFSEHLGRCIYGGFYVGEKSAIPNRAGVRTDVVEALKKLKTPNLRWPGGCFADTYHWKDGIGLKDQRPSMLNVWWGGEVVWEVGRDGEKIAILRIRLYEKQERRNRHPGDTAPFRPGQQQGA